MKPPEPPGTEEEPVEALRRQLTDLLGNEAEGAAGRRIKEAGAYRTTVVSRIESDVEQYRTLLPEYQRNPLMLINRLWEETRQQILGSSGVTKFFRPKGLKEIRIKIPLDPEERRIEEQRRLERKDFDPGKLREERLVPIGPEHG